MRLRYSCMYWELRITRDEEDEEKISQIFFYVTDFSFGIKGKKKIEENVDAYGLLLQCFVNRKQNIKHHDDEPTIVIRNC